MFANEKYVVDGLKFASNLHAKEAENEISAINYILSHTDMSNLEEVNNVYQKVIKKEVFKTPIGIKFLKEIQDLLVNSGKFDEGEIFCIPVGTKMTSLSINRTNNHQANIKLIHKYKIKYRSSLMVNVVLMLLVIIMFIIAKNSTTNVNVINYERNILDKYSAWAEELNEKESNLNEKESLLFDQD